VVTVRVRQLKRRFKCLYSAQCAPLENSDPSSARTAAHVTYQMQLSELHNAKQDLVQQAHRCTGECSPADNIFISFLLMSA